MTTRLISVRRSAAIAALAVAAIFGGAVSSLARAKTGARVPIYEAIKTHGDEPASMTGFAPVVKRDQPAVVNISSSKVVRTEGGGIFGPMDPFFQQFFGDGFSGPFQVPRQRLERSLGSGVIISPDGYLLTNNHVVDGATDIEVTLSDKREFKAHVIGTDPKTDIAVLRVDAQNLPTLPLGDSAKVEVGDLVLALGNPFGVGQTVTMGIVSATGRGNLGIEDYEDFIQTDAAINPGNSGGALVNDGGELIGINTAIISGGSGGNQGIGFAIPVNMARTVMEEILKNGKVTRAWLGVMLQEVTPEVAKAFALSKTAGALVGDVTPGSPAAHSDIQKGDILLSVDGQPVSDANQLRLKISMMKPGTKVRLDVFRNGRKIEVPVTLGELPSDSSAAGNNAAEPGNALQGLSIDELTPEIARELGLRPGTQGVVISGVDSASPAAEAGLQRGDVIAEVNRKPVRSVAEFEQAAKQARRQPVLLLVNRGGSTQYVVLEAS